MESDKMKRAMKIQAKASKKREEPRALPRDVLRACTGGIPLGRPARERRRRWTPSPAAPAAAQQEEREGHRAAAAAVGHRAAAEHARARARGRARIVGVIVVGGVVSAAARAADAR